MQFHPADAPAGLLLHFEASSDGIVTVSILPPPQAGVAGMRRCSSFRRIKYSSERCAVLFVDLDAPPQAPEEARTRQLLVPPGEVVTVLSGLKGVCRAAGAESEIPESVTLARGS
eukprot:Hpha_TRINITY_DN28595_c0_g1::TRINITY_DN28595_c0_g1_i1::g.18654::m.18654